MHKIHPNTDRRVRRPIFVGFERHTDHFGIRDDEVRLIFDVGEGVEKVSVEADHFGGVRVRPWCSEDPELGELLQAEAQRVISLAQLGNALKEIA